MSAHFTLSWAAAWIAAYSCRRDDAEEVAEADDLRALDVLDRALVDRDDLRRRAVAVGALAARPHDAAVEHARDADVVDVGRLAGDLVRDVDPRRARADDLVLADRLRARRARDGLGRRRRVAGGREARDLDVEQLVADQRAVGDGLAAARDDALLDREARLRRRRGSSRRGRAARSSRPRPRHGSACRPSARPGCRRSRPGSASRSCRGRSASSGEAHVELLGRDHQQRGRRALAHLDLADLQAGRVVGVDREPRVDRDLVERAARRVRVGWRPSRPSRRRRRRRR